MHPALAITWNFLWWPQTGQWYAFWSSFGACLTYFAVIGVAYRHLKCRSCWRIAHHRVDGTNYKTCHKHTTPAEHTRLSEMHARKFPEQHKLLSKAHAALSASASAPAPVPDGSQLGDPARGPL